jgi:glutamyl-tRNA reductase
MHRTNGSLRPIVVGLSHRSAPIELREKVAVSAAALPSVLQELAELEIFEELVLLSTCNRIELLALTVDEERAIETAVEFFARRGGGSAETRERLYRLQGEAAVSHLFRVAASLDSIVVGEPQILGQVKTAYREACDAGVAGDGLRRLFDKAFAVAKRVRSQTRIGHSGLSTASVAIEALSRAMNGFDGRTVLVVGAGQMGEAALHRLRKLQASSLLMANRTLERACDEARKAGAQAVDWTEIKSLLETVDAAVYSTAAPHVVLTRGQVEAAMAARGGRPLFLADLAMPRDIDPQAAAVPGVTLWDVDSLSGAVIENQELRRLEAEKAEGIVEAEATRWSARHVAQPVLAASV